MFTSPEGEVVDVNSEAKVPGHIVFTRIFSLYISPFSAGSAGTYGDKRPANIVARCDTIIRNPYVQSIEIDPPPA